MVFKKLLGPVFACFALATMLTACEGAPIENEGTGQIRASITAPERPYDISFVRFRVIERDDSCRNPTGQIFASADVPLHEEMLPTQLDLVEQEVGEDHHFADKLFVLLPDVYTVCALPMAEGGLCESCNVAKANATVIEGMTTEIELRMDCQGVSSGSVDVVGWFNDPPFIEDLVIEPSKFLMLCQEGSLQVMASDPNDDKLSYEWKVLEGSTKYDLDSPTRQTTHFISGQAGKYQLQIRVVDEFGLSTSLLFPIYVMSEESVCD
jgi:hypothetical protein